MSSRARRRLFALLTVLVSTLFALLLAEAGMRIAGYSPASVNPLATFHTYDPELGIRLKPSFTGRFKRPDFDVVISSDDSGFRKQERQHPEATSAYRLFCLGDSYTWGFGVGQGETYTDYLSDRLADAHVVNLGVNGTGTVYQWRLYRRAVAPRVRPDDVVLVLFCNNDFGDNVNQSGRMPYAVVEGERVTIAPPKLVLQQGFKNWLKESSYLYNWAAYCVDAIKLSRRVETETGLGEKVGADEHQPGRVATRFAMKNLAQEVRDKGARFVMARIPHPSEFAAETTPAEPGSAGSNAQGFRRAFEAICAAEGIETIDLMPALRGDVKSGGYAVHYLKIDTHWSPAGQAKAADAIADGITRMRAKPK